MLGVVFGLGHDFHAEVVDGIYAAAGDHGYEVVLSGVSARRTESDAVRAVLAERCEAVVLIGSQLASRDIAKLAGRLPTVSRTPPAAGACRRRRQDRRGRRARGAGRPSPRPRPRTHRVPGRRERAGRAPRRRGYSLPWTGGSWSPRRWRRAHRGVGSEGRRPDPPCSKPGPPPSPHSTTDALSDSCTRSSGAASSTRGHLRRRLRRHRGRWVHPRRPHHAPTGHRPARRSSRWIAFDTGSKTMQLLRPNRGSPRDARGPRHHSSARHLRTLRTPGTNSTARMYASTGRGHPSHLRYLCPDDLEGNQALLDKPRQGHRLV